MILARRLFLVVVLFGLVLSQVEARGPKHEAHKQSTLNIGRKTDIAKQIEGLRRAIVATMKLLRAQAQTLKELRNQMMTTTDKELRYKVEIKAHNVIKKMEKTTAKLKGLQRQLEALLAKSSTSTESKTVKIINLRRGNALKRYTSQRVRAVQKTVGAPKAYNKMPQLSKRIYKLRKSLSALHKALRPVPKGAKKYLGYGQPPGMGGLDIDD